MATLNISAVKEKSDVTILNNLTPEQLEIEVSKVL